MTVFSHSLLISTLEFEVAVEKLKSCILPGIDQIPAEFIKQVVGQTL